MSDFTLIIGNKNYSSWSLRGWLALKHTGVEFGEIVIPLRRPETPGLLREHSPSAKVPNLKSPDGDIWDSLAMCEYLAESFPAAGLWPAAKTTRAHARAVSAEMHSGFAALRSAMPMNMRDTLPMPELKDDLAKDIARVETIWQDCRQRFGQDGPFLYGAFSIADCMFAPVASRFATYQTPVSQLSQAYIGSLHAWPDMIEWMAAAKDEPWVIEF